MESDRFIMQLSVNAQFDFDGISAVLDRHGFGNHGIVQKTIDNAVIRWCIERGVDRVSPSAVRAVRRKGHYPESQKDADCQAASWFYLPKDQIHPVTQRQGITAALPRERHPGAPQNQEIFQFPASGADDDGADSHLLYVVARVAFQKAGPPFCSLHRFAVL